MIIVNISYVMIDTYLALRMTSSEWISEQFRQNLLFLWSALAKKFYFHLSEMLQILSLSNTLPG